MPTEPLCLPPLCGLGEHLVGVDVETSGNDRRRNLRFMALRDDLALLHLAPQAMPTINRSAREVFQVANLGRRQQRLRQRFRRPSANQPQ